MRVTIGNVNVGCVGAVLLAPFVVLAQLISIPFRILVKLANMAERRRH